MGEPPKTPDTALGRADEGREAEDRDAILGRRARFIATALGALAIGSAAVQGGCDPEVTRETSSAGGEGGAGGAPQPCLDVAPPDSVASSSSGEGGMPQPCLGMPAEGGGGMGGSGVSDGGGDAGGAGGAGTSAGGGGGAAPCLAPAIRLPR